jgi:hypothetical protein
MSVKRNVTAPVGSDRVLEFVRCLNGLFSTTGMAPTPEQRVAVRSMAAKYSFPVSSYTAAAGCKGS